MLYAPLACLNAPVGYDAYGYGYRDKTGEKVYCSRPQKFAEPFQTGDVIGLFIHLPPKTDAFKSPARKRIPIAYKEHLWFEEKDFRTSKEMEQLADPYYKPTSPEEDYCPARIPGSYMAVYKNGVYQGKMFEDLIDYEDFGRLPEHVLAKHNKKRKKQKKLADVEMPRVRVEEDEFDGVRHQQWTEDPPLKDDGTLGYFPAISVFRGGMVTCNFGPQFQYEPQEENWKPMSQRYDEYMAEECMWDMLDEISKAWRRNM